MLREIPDPARQQRHLIGTEREDDNFGARGKYFRHDDVER